MGTRIRVFLSHELPSFQDTAQFLKRLRRTEATCRKVTEYWRTEEPYDRDATEWSVREALDDEVRYEGPGSLWLNITARSARIQTGARWRGFLSIEPLRRVHLAAFRSIAAALGSETMAISHDSNDDVHQVFWAGATQVQCITALQAEFGDPQPSIESIEPSVEAMTEHGVPDVWYLERVSTAGSPADTG